ncbi:MAG: c-type cytochrome [Bryobacteraceae bacterium]
MQLALRFAALCLLAPFVGSTQPAPNRSRDIAEGRAFFNRSCTMCHGLDGAAGDRGPALSGGRRFLRQSERDLFDAIRKGIPGTMMPPTDLGDAEVHKIVVYIRGLRATAFDAALPGDIRAGERIFWDKANCGECHMLRGRGGIMGPDLSDIGGTKTAVTLRDALTQPAPLVPRGYRPAQIITADGHKLIGLVRNENNFSI